MYVPINFPMIYLSSRDMKRNGLIYVRSLFMVALFILSVTFTDVLQVLCFAKAVYK